MKKVLSVLLAVLLLGGVFGVGATAVQYPCTQNTCVDWCSCDFTRALWLAELPYALQTGVEFSEFYAAMRDAHSYDCRLDVIVASFSPNALHVLEALRHIDWLRTNAEALSNDEALFAQMDELYAEIWQKINATQNLTETDWTAFVVIAERIAADMDQLLGDAGLFDMPQPPRGPLVRFVAFQGRIIEWLQTMPLILQAILLIPLLPFLVLTLPIVLPIDFIWWRWFR